MGIAVNVEDVPGVTVLTLEGELSLDSGDVLALTVNGAERASRTVPQGKKLKLEVRMVGHLTDAS